MSERRTRMIQAMTARGCSPRTQEAYVRAVVGLARHYRPARPISSRPRRCQRTWLGAGGLEEGLQGPVDKLAGGLGPGRLSCGEPVVIEAVQELPRDFDVQKRTSAHGHILLRLAPYGEDPAFVVTIQPLLSGGVGCRLPVQEPEHRRPLAPMDHVNIVDERDLGQAPVRLADYVAAQSAAQQAATKKVSALPTASGGTTR